MTEAVKASSSTARYFLRKATGAPEKTGKIFFPYDFPVAHWIHIRTTNLIGFTFPTVRLETAKTRSCGSREMTLAMVFKLIQSAEKRWKRIKGFDLIGEVIEGVLFKDGVRATDQADRNAA